jgi:biotin transport system substrate-specific component
MTRDFALGAERRSPRVTAIGIVGFAAALALASQVAIPVPGTPVPITLQPFVVALTGFWLGPVAGAASMMLYLAVGATGVPVFSPFGAPGIARFFGPTGGYLLAYPAAAFLSGWLGRRTKTLAGRSLAAMASIAMLFVGGLLHLAILNGSFARAIEIGMHPFVPLDAAKAILAALLAPRRGARGTS